MKRMQNEYGIALVMTIVGLVVVGSLVVTLASLTVIELRQSFNTRRMEQAFGAAEYGLGEIVGNWNSASLNSLAVNSTATITGSTANGSGTYTATVRRLNNEFFLVNVTAQDAGGATRQRVGGFVKLRTIDMTITAALTTQGNTRIGGSAQLTGLDDAPLSWTSCPPDSNVAGVTVPDPSDLTLQGSCSDASCIDGDPPIQIDPGINDSTFFKYGDMDWNDLVGMTTMVLPPATYTGIGPVFDVDGRCDTGVITNWGDPYTPTSTCGGYFPMMYVPGNVNISGGVGQGMLLVEGNLSVQGGFEFYGIVIVRGSLKTTGTGGHFNGAVLAANVDMDVNTVLGNALVQYSSCANDRVLTNAAPGTLLRSRGWLYTY